jgi:hypothetical protein
VNRRSLLIAGAATAGIIPVVGATRALAGTERPGGEARDDSAAEAAALATTQVSASGAWCWFGDARALHFEGAQKRTYIGFITSGGDVRVAQFDHRTGAWRTIIVALGFQIDDHNSPSLIMRPDRRLVVFWSGHAGDTMYYRRTARAEDISAWEPVKTVPVNTAGSAGYTYPNPVQLSAERNALYLFWRGGNMNPTYAVTTGSDRWSAARGLVLVPGQRPYLKVASNGVDTIHFAFTDGHPRNVRTSIYYMYYRDGSLFRADGTRIGPMGTPVHPEQASKVYNSTGNTFGRAWIHDIAIDRTGRPTVVYATFPSDTDHRYRYARWTGTGWFDRQLTIAGGSIQEDGGEPHYSGGITLDPDNPSVVLCSRQFAGIHEIQRWTTPDGGATWRIEHITSGSRESNVRPISPRGLPSSEPLGVIWMAGRYPNYKRFQTRILATR